MERKLIPSKCPLCGGNVASGTTTFTVDLKTGLIVVRDVPALICAQCGEEWIENAVSIKLEMITDRARLQNTQLEVVLMV
ncbi:MAG: type II toxin-antitoxin system MqsA family antitoxin [Saprospirales bacterium]|nr:type II toxin-antitoxin system MqsA family antitoxin [Saprospirales bacterium]MBK8921434.1 type II toxin-antitoxin system MqsA family antitoxin [Saprospirales bacterium]